MPTIFEQIANELGISTQQVSATVTLLDEGSTVPFIARYRKEITHNLDDGQLRSLETRLRYLREMEDRRSIIINSIDEQGKLTDTLKQSILNAVTKNQLEDLYLPYKPKRRTKGQIAIEAGLEPLANALYDNPSLTPEEEAQQYLNNAANITSTKEALDGAKYILMEHFSEDADLLGKLRAFLNEQGMIQASVIAGKEKAGEKFSDYFEHQELLKKIPSHRALALFRGRNEGILSLKLTIKDNELADKHPCEVDIAKHWHIEHQNRPSDDWLAEVVRWTWRIKLLTHLETDLFTQIREKAEASAIDVFAANLRDLLLAAPAGQKNTIGLDPGLRTGVKVAVIDATGKVLDHAAIFPHVPQRRTEEAEITLIELCQKYDAELIAIGNGTASRETEAFAKEVLKKHNRHQSKVVVVSEAGASVYSASELAANELPELDVTIRGAVSIARRLQDPLAELVKIEPKSIGVGQYQHDVSQSKLAQALDTMIEDCVNQVGVEINTASVPLLARVSGLNTTIANNIVAFRDQQGRFTRREQLKKVSRLGDKTYEQCAGFLRIANGDNPLDASAVHPESYSIVESVSEYTQKSIGALLQDSAIIRSINAKDFTNERFGLPTVQDIFAELEKPGRDPRPEFKTASFKEGIHTLNDLNAGMILEGVITNVTNFGAFVDIGVHQDGLVHISALTDRYISDPRTVVKTGDIVTVKVMDVDIPRKRIALSMRLHDQPEQSTEEKTKRAPKSTKKPLKSTQKFPKGSMGDLLEAALKQQKKN